MGEPTGRHVFCSSWPYFGNNAPSSDSHRRRELQKIQKKCAVARLFRARSGISLILAIVLAGCKPSGEAEVPVAAVEREPELMCGDRGQVRAELYGAISTRLQWNQNQLECSGMPRPQGQGVRLRFAGNVSEDDRRIAVIIALPDLRRAAIGDEYASNVTVIEEGSGRFFSSSSPDNCLTDITMLDAIDQTGDRFSISGVLYCVSPLAEVNGTSSVSLRELQFSGLLDWSAS